MTLSRWTFVLPAFAFLAIGAVPDVARADVGATQAGNAQASAVVVAKSSVRRPAAASVAAARAYGECRHLGCGRYVIVGISY
jgi:hypothetical protein